jgi:hypothetical protein
MQKSPSKERIIPLPVKGGFGFVPQEALVHPSCDIKEQRHYERKKTVHTFCF